MKGADFCAMDEACPNVAEGYSAFAREDLDAMIAPEAFHVTREAQAQSLRDARKIEEATAAYSALVKAHPERADYVYELGLLKLQGGDQAEAIEAFEAFARHQDGASSPEVRIARLREVSGRSE